MWDSTPPKWKNCFSCKLQRGEQTRHLRGLCGKCSASCEKSERRPCLAEFFDLSSHCGLVLCRKNSRPDWSFGAIWGQTEHFRANAARKCLVSPRIAARDCLVNVANLRSTRIASEHSLLLVRGAIVDQPAGPADQSTRDSSFTAACQSAYRGYPSHPMCSPIRPPVNPRVGTGIG